jgi:hypothetical protein
MESKEFKCPLIVIKFLMKQHEYYKGHHSTVVSPLARALLTRFKFLWLHRGCLYLRRGGESPLPHFFKKTLSISSKLQMVGLLD